MYTFETSKIVYSTNMSEMKLFILSVFVLVYKSSGYEIYWNVPTESCHKYGYNFSHLINYGIIQNTYDSFKGDKITILYDPGLYPAIIDGRDRNGGVPQNGNIELHLQKFEKDLIKSIPNKDFKGIGIIDFEHWRPIWRENWSSLDIYRKRSKEIVKKKHPYWNDSSIEKEATKNFEKSAYQFIQKSLQLAIKNRPKGKWGYYAFPYCFNLSPKNPSTDCDSKVKNDNDKSKWMYKISTGLYPSVYLQEKKLNPNKNAKLIQGRIKEGLRIASKGKNIHVLPYTWFKYQDTLNFLIKEDMSSNILIPKKTGAAGVIIWGSTNDVNTKGKCQKLDEYTRNVLRPILKKI